MTDRDRTAAHLEPTDARGDEYVPVPGDAGLGYAGVGRCQGYAFWEGFSVRCAKAEGHDGEHRGWKDITGWPGPEQPASVSGPGAGQDEGQSDA